MSADFHELTTVKPLPVRGETPWRKGTLSPSRSWCSRPSARKNAHAASWTWPRRWSSGSEHGALTFQPLPIFDQIFLGTHDSPFLKGPMILNGIVSFHSNFQPWGQEPGRPPEAEWDPHIWAEEADRAAGSNWSNWSNLAMIGLGRG